MSKNKNICNIFKVVKLSFQYVPLFTIFWILIYLLSLVVGFAFPVLQSYLISKLSESNEISLHIIVVVILISSSSFVLQPVLSLLNQYIDIYYFNSFNKKLTIKMLEKQIYNLDNDDFCDSEKMNMINYCYTIKNKIINIFRILSYSLIDLFLCKIIYVVLIFKYNIILGSIALTYICIKTFFDLKINKKKINFDKDKSMIKRQGSYYSSLLFDKINALNIRYLKIQENIGEISICKNNNIVNDYYRMEKKYCLIIDFLDLINKLIRYGSMFFVIYLVYIGSFKVTEGIFLYSIFKSSLTSLESFSRMLNRVTSSSSYINDFDFFLKKQNQKRNLNFNNKFDKIKMSNIKYKYINGDSYAVENVDLDINKGEVVSILGENGSGKTTLVKILIGILQKYEGIIEVNDEEINESSILNKIFSCSFQDFYIYSLKFYENILICNSTLINNSTEIEKVKNIYLLKELIEKLPNGIHTNINKNINKDGIELSGGELQKIILARAIIGDKEIIVFDEPTAAIDPIKEKEFLELIKELSQNKTAIIISHRIPFAKIAQKIYLMSEGKIIEKGTHDELLKKRGTYFDMYNNQKKLYEIQ